MSRTLAAFLLLPGCSKRVEVCDTAAFACAEPGADGIPGTSTGGNTDEDEDEDDGWDESGVHEDLQEPDYDVGAEPDADPDLPTEAVVYAHSADILYRLDAETLELTEVGMFSGCTRVVDIAVDRDGNLFASASLPSNRICTCDTATAACAPLVDVQFANNLSFVPAGVLHPDHEILVTFSGAQYLSIDPGTGELTNLGVLPSTVSGDIVSIKEGPTYVTVGTPGVVDHLLEIDPTDATVLQDLGPIANETEVYGLAYWGGTIYAFGENGHLLTVQDNGDGTNVALLIEETAVAFWGAGSTTHAPITPEG